MGGVAGLVLAIIILCIAYQNDEECHAMQCPSGGTARLLDHECVCTETPLPKGAASTAAKEGSK